MAPAAAAGAVVGRAGNLQVPQMPFFDPDFCQWRCPICTAARKGNRLARLIQRIELLLTLGGCPWGRARQAKYGVPPDQPLPDASGGSRSSEGPAHCGF